MKPQVQPLSYRHRNTFFLLLATIFASSLPFLFLYATGYRFDFLQTGFVSTGGLYVSAERTGAEIYINDELVRETRVFRRAFYSQGLEAGTHRVHVQKIGHHTWVKELPVYPHLVTEAQSFNLPEVAVVRVISPWQTASGINVLTSTSSVLQVADVSNQYLFEPRAATSTMIANPEFTSLIKNFQPATSTATSSPTVADRARLVVSNVTSSSPEETQATTTKEWRGVRLYESEDEVYATFVGNISQMPYYYCASEFPRYVPKTSSSTTAIHVASVAAAAEKENLPLEVQTVTPNEPCEPIIKIDRAHEKVEYFDFFPNSTDLVVLASNSGIYVVEIDDRSWQNRQPLLQVPGLKAVVQNGSIYIYDGNYIYQVVINQNWF